MPQKTLKMRCLLLVCCFAFLQAGAQVGINTSTPLSTLDLNGNLSLKAIGISPTFNGGPAGNAKQINDGVYISLTPTAGNVEFIVPAASTYPGRIYILRNISNSVTAQIYSFGGQFFAKDSNTATTAPINMPANALLKTIILISDGSNWTYIF
jgi:hypothetical protein